MTEEERRQRLLRMGLDPAKYRYVTNEEAAMEDTTRASAAWTGVKQAPGPLAGALALGKAGMALGAGGGPVGVAAGGIIGSVVGGLAGAFGQSAIEDAVLDDADERALALERQAAAKKYPYTTYFSQVLPTLGVVKPSLSVLKSIPQAIKNAPLRTQTALQKYALTNVGVGGGIEAGVEAGMQAMSGEEMDYGRVALAGLVGGALTEPTKLGRRIYGTPTRPLTEAEAIAKAPEIRAEVSAERELELSKLAAEAEEAATAKAKTDAEEAKKQETTASEDIEAKRNDHDEVRKRNDEYDKAQRARHAAEKEFNDAREKHGIDHTLTAAAQKKANKALANEMTAGQRLSDAHAEAAALRKQVADETAEAGALAERAAARHKKVTGEDMTLPPADVVLRAAKGLAERLGMGWRAAVADVVRYSDSDKLRGAYNLNQHAAAVNKKLERIDTAPHEAIHGLWQVLKRGNDPKHKGLIDFFEKDLFKDSKTRAGISKEADKRIWAEEQLVEGAGRMFVKRLNNAPKSLMDKLKRYVDDIRLEQEARKGFQPKVSKHDNELSSQHLTRISEWLAMRAERQPALQPEALRSFLKGLPLEMPGMKIADGVEYSKDAGDLALEVKEDIRFQLTEDGKKTRDKIVKKIVAEEAAKEKQQTEQVYKGLDVVSKYDPKYSKRVRAKLSVADAQKAMAQFANKPFPPKMSGEEIAQVINGLEMYHGSKDPEAVLREGFKGEELKVTSQLGRGIYMTADKGFASGFNENIISIRTNFKKLFNLDQKYSAEDAIKFINDYIDTAKSLGLDKVEGSLRSQSGAGSEFLTAPEKFKENVFTSVFDMRYRTASEVQKFLRIRPRDITGKSLINGLLEMSGAGYGRPTDSNHAKILSAMGYDGMTQIGAGEVVAFREPFQKADGLLQEYYTSKRLQTAEGGLDPKKLSEEDPYGMDELFKHMNEYQLTSATDHFATNPSLLHKLKLSSVVDSVRFAGESPEERKRAHEVADALAATARDSRELQGRFIEDLMLKISGNKLSKKDAEFLQTYMVYKRAKLDIPADVQRAYDAPDSNIRHYHEFLVKKYHEEAGEILVSSDIDVYSRKTGEFRPRSLDKNYVPETINSEKLRALQGDFGSVEQQKAKKELLEYWREERVDDVSITDADLEVAVNKYISKSVDFDNDLGSTKYGAVRKVEGLGLPKTRDKETGMLTWIEPNAVNNYSRYFKRFADDVSFYNNIEKNANVAAALGVAHKGKHLAALVNSPFITPIKTEIVDGRKVSINAGMTKHPAIRNFMKGYKGYYEGAELVGRTVNRVVTSHWLGLMSGIRDLFTSYALALPYLSWHNAKAFTDSFALWKDSWNKSFLYGVNKKKTNRIEYGLETHTKILNGLDHWSDFMARYSGRNALEQVTRASQFALGRAVVMQNVGLPDSNRTAMRTLEVLSKMSGVDQRLMRLHANKAKDFKMQKGNKLFDNLNKRLKEKGLPQIPEYDDAVGKMAAAWVEVNQGTYDVRGVPSWTLFGAPSLFTSLSRWTVEKTSRMQTDVLNPLLDEGDVRPLIKATLGAVITGALLQKVSNEVYNKLQGTPTFEESLQAENKEEATYAVINMLNQAGYFGLVSAFLNDFARTQQGYNVDIPGGFVFPAYDFFTGLSDPLLDFTRAVEEGAPVIETFGKMFNDVMKRTTQSYRVLLQHTFQSEEMDKANMRRDYRVFRRLEGFADAPVSPTMGNKYMRPDTREFKEAETVGEMVETIPGALQEQIERANRRPDKLKSYVQGLYTTSDKTMPSVATKEGVEEFLRYRNFMLEMGRGEDWERTFREWARNKQLAPARKAVVKGYIQQRIGG